MSPHLLRSQGLAIPMESGWLRPWTPRIWDNLNFRSVRVSILTVFMDKILDIQKIAGIAAITGMRRQIHQD